MKRRPIITALATASVLGRLVRSHAQARPRRRPRVGMLTNFPVMDPVDWKWFWRGMAQRGWEDGVNIDVDKRYAMNDREKYRANARELVTSDCDLLFAIGADAADAAVQATRTIPIVIIAAAAVEVGYAKSLARPDGNVTGVVAQSLDLAGKGLDLLRAFRPDLRRLGLVHQSGDPLSERWLKSWRDPALRHSVSVVPLPSMQSQWDVETMLGAAGREQVQALVTEGPTPLMLGSGFDRLLAWTIEHKVLSFSTSRLRGEHLATLGPDVVEMRRIAMSQIDRILRGARPADIPIVQADRFELTVHRRIAKTLGLVIPQAVLLQATEVIE